MKTGISIDVGNMDEFNDQITAAEKAGFRYCQVFYRGDDIDTNIAEEIAAICKKKNIGIGPLGCYLSALKPFERPMGYDLDKTHRLIDLMPVIGSRQLIIWSGTLSDEHIFQYDERNFTEEAFEKLTGVTSELINHLVKVNGYLSIEPFFTHIINDPESFKKLKEVSVPDRLKIVMDIPNFFRKGMFPQRDEIINNLFRDLAGDISMVHFKDIKEAKDDSWPYEYPGPGKGDLNYEIFMENISRHNFNSWGIIEHVQPSEFEDAKKFLDAQSAIINK
jgi:sugar phosphate isomerase/epimerase